MQLNNNLAELLRQSYNDRGQSWSALATHIENANDEKIKIDRRKLRRICEGGEDVKLSIKELKAFQRYLYKNKMIPIETFLFRPPKSLLDALNGESKIGVFYSARYLDTIRTEVASVWDLRAVATLLGTPEISDLVVSLHNVFHFGKDRTNVTKLRTEAKKESWYAALNKDRAVVSIGSPFVSYATEEILCRMFNIPPFVPYGYSANKQLPFYLYWPEQHKTTDSAFSISWDELNRLDEKATEKMAVNDRALVIGDKIYVAESSGTSSNLILAQYYRGHLVLVLIGIYAPATLAIAQCIADRAIVQTLPAYGNNKTGNKNDDYTPPILMTLIQTLIEKAPSKDREGMRDHRELRTKETNVLKTELWECSGDTWQAV